jgi:hypothetical protein
VMVRGGFCRLVEPDQFGRFQVAYHYRMSLLSD